MSKPDNTQLAILMSLTFVVGVLVGALGMAVLGPEARLARERKQEQESMILNHMEAARLEEDIRRAGVRDPNPQRGPKSPR